MTTAAISYYSLAPADTCIWKTVNEGCCLAKIALAVISIVVLPLELLGRLVANGAIAIYSLFQANPNLEQRTSTVAADILNAEKSLPAQQLTQEICQLKVRGTLNGQVIGDGLGMFTEFLSRAVAQSLKPAHLEFSDRPKFSRDHVDRFPQDGWTDDSDQFLLILYCVVESTKFLNLSKECRMAAHLLNWRNHGLNGFSTISGLSFVSRQDDSSSDPHRKKIGCQGLGAMTAQVLKQRNFSTDPFRAARAVWAEGGKNVQDRPAANGAIMRTAILGPLYRNNLTQAVAEARRFAQVTHADPRCVASAVALTVAIAMLHRGASAEQALSHAESIAVAVLQEEMQTLQLPTNGFETELRQCMHASLEQLQLGTGLIGYTYKCLGAAFYALRRAMALMKEKDASPEAVFRTTLEEIIFEGGDADTNGAAAGALLGAYLGESAIPKLWRKGLHKQDKLVLEEAFQYVQTLTQDAL